MSPGAPAEREPSGAFGGLTGFLSLAQILHLQICRYMSSLSAYQ